MMMFVMVMFVMVITIMTIMTSRNFVSVKIFDFLCDYDDDDDVCDGDHDFLGDDDITSKKLSTLR